MQYVNIREIKILGTRVSSSVKYKVVDIGILFLIPLGHSDLFS